jgi:ferrous iron transport protein B
MPELGEAFERAREELQDRRSSQRLKAQDRYQWTEFVQREVIHASPELQKRNRTDKIDQILIHRFFGLFIFIALMYLVFQSIYTFAAPVMKMIDDGFGVLGDKVGSLVPNEVARSAVVDGLIGGVGGALVFLPQILILFFFIAVLEGTGYLARAAFLMDRLLGWCGLNGRAFIPLLSSFACAIPGVMAARVMPDPKSRLATILVAPLMSCSARLPVYLLLIGAFVQPKFGAGAAGLALFGMHLVGLVVAIPVVWVLNRKIFRGTRLPFVLELPPYQWPIWRDVWLSMLSRGKVFVKTAGTIIVAMSMLIWALSYFPRSQEADARYRESFTASRQVNLNDPKVQAQLEAHIDEERLAHSYLGTFGKAIEPVFVPAGFDWRITTGILSAFPAREVVVPALGIIFSLGSEVDEGSGDLRDAMKQATWPDGRPLFTIWTAAGLMVFFALCCQCMATLAAVRRETNSWKWPVFMFCYMTGLAYLFAVAIHQAGRFFS